MGGAHSSTLHVMKPVELIAEFGLTKRDILSFESSFNAIRGSSAFITRALWIDHWNGPERPIDPDNNELGLRIWKAFDVDGNDKMDLDEWSLFCAISQFGSQKHKLTASFALCDKSQDGLVAESEVVNVLFRNLRMSKRTEMLEKMKADGSSGRSLAKASRRVSLTKEESKMVKERAKEIMAIADKDKNGKISLEEFLQAAEEKPELFQDLLI